MVLDFPTFTKIGVQSNTSAYTSSNWNLSFNYRSFAVSIQKPTKLQKIINIFRINHLIKHDREEEIKDWNIERVSLSNCTSYDVSTVLGMELCRETSYPNVTKLIRPWFLMAGWVKWTFILKPFDKELKSYNVAILPLHNQEKDKIFQINFNAPGIYYQREVKAQVKINTEIKEIWIAVPEVPDFQFLFTSRNFNGSMCYESFFKYAFHQIYNFTLLVNKENGKNGNNGAKRHKNLIKKIQINFDSPINSYAYIHMINVTHQKLSIDLTFSYKNTNDTSKWLHHILPNEFWMNGNEAWIHTKLTWKYNKHQCYPEFHASTKIPHQFGSFDINSECSSNKLQMQFNYNLVNLKERKLLTFGNITYYWRKLSNIHVANLTFPSCSYSVEAQKKSDSKTSLYYLSITGSQTLNLKQCLNCDFKRWQIKCFLNLSKSREDKLSNEAKMSLDANQSEQINYERKQTIINASITYPFYGNQENVTFNGTLIYMNGVQPWFYSFQKDFAVLSSYHNLQLDSHSVYLIEENEVLISHNSYFTHLTTYTKAFYNLAYKQRSQDGCMLINFNHNIDSDVFNFTSTIDLQCQPERKEMYELKISIDTYSPQWDMLNSELRQVFLSDKVLRIGQESMNFSHPLLVINVMANWNYTEGATLFHQKIAKFMRKDDFVPVVVIDMNEWPSGLKEILINIDPILNQTIKLSRLKSLKLIQYDMSFINIGGNKCSQAEAVLTLKLHLLNLYEQVVQGRIGISCLKYLFNKTEHFFLEIRNDTDIIVQDQEHPLNKILNPVLKTTVKNYTEMIKTEMTNQFLQMQKNAAEIVAWSSLLPGSKMIANIHKEMRTFAFWAEKSFKTTTVGWLFYYFEIPLLIEEYWNNFKIKDYLKDSFPDVLQFSYKMNNLFLWESSNLNPQLLATSPDPEYTVSKRKKIAMIFGPSHVYTFDGKLYEIPKYPSPDCSLLLAHDLRNFSFSIITTAESLYILFPELALTINSMNQIFVNGSKEQHYLPIHSISNRIKITREGRLIIVLTGHLTVICDGSSFLCLFLLDEHLYGATFGILGNADDEIHNEYMFPNGSVQNSITEVAKLYEMSGKEECQNFEKLPERILYKTTQECSEFLTNYCSEIMGIKDTFTEACRQDLTDKNFTYSAMSALCFYHGFQSAPPNGFLKKEKSKIKQILDVGVIVDQHFTMFNGGSSKGLQNILRSVENTFSSNGYNIIKYSLIGYGDNPPNNEPHLLTIKETIWVSYSEMIESFQLLRFSGTKKEDPISAMMYAITTLGWNSFNSKVFLLFASSDIKVLDVALLNKMQQILKKNGITLYTFSSYPTISKGKKVFGVRSDGYIFPQPESKGESFIDYPKGSLAKLTSATQGSVFLKQFVESNELNLFFSTVAEEIYSKVHQETQKCRHCQLVRGKWWYLEEECSIVECD